MKCLIYSFLFVFLLISFENKAQSKFQRGTIGFSSGTTQYNGDIVNDFYSFRTSNPFTAIDYSHYASARIDIRLGVAFGSWGYTSKKSNSFDADFVNANLDVKIKFITRENPRWSPYVFGGIGMNQFSNWTLLNPYDDAIDYDTQGRFISRDDLQRWSGIFSAGAGVQVRLAERVFLRFDERFLFPTSDASDGIVAKSSDVMLRHTLGISFGLFPWRDTDQDGVSDKDDICPATPTIAKIDANGCPIDSDQDGISDFEDECGDVPGVSSGKGCPDADGDTFVDNVDDCPLDAGSAAFNGCPDKDGDGIKDLDDRCPEIKGLQKFKGCVDSDNDGVADPDDVCASTTSISKVDEKGCPLDRDHDNIADYLDQCPEDAGVAENNGCPLVKEEVKELFRRALSGIKFETGKDIIKKESFAILDTVVQIMIANPSYKLNIFGHTDNVGDVQKNLMLSQARADAVSSYLEQRGLEGRMPEVIGYGDQKPIADNSTKEGRLLNRRVEFEVVF